MLLDLCHDMPHGIPLALRPIWNTKRVTARRVRQRIAAMMKWAIAKGYPADNPADEQVLQALPKNGDKREYLPALPHDRVGGALETTRATETWPSTKLSLECVVFTVARSREVRLASWKEMDVEWAVWTNSGERMKVNREPSVRRPAVRKMDRSMRRGQSLG